MSLARNTTLALLAITLGSVGTAAAQGGPPAGTTVVYINSQQVVQSAPGAAEAERTFQRELDDWQTDLRADAAVLDSLMQDYRRQEVMLSPQAKEQKQSELRTRQQALTTKQQELQNRAQQRQNELLQPILDRVTGTIEQLRAERNYAIVLDASNPGVVAADPALDITDLVVQRLGGTPAAPAPGGTP